MAWKVRAYQLALLGRWPITVSWIKPAFINSRFARVIVSALTQPLCLRWEYDAIKRPLLSDLY